MVNDYENIALDINYSSEEDKEEKGENKNVVQGEAFKKLQKKAKRLCTKSLDYSKRKDEEYVIILESGKKIPFGSTKYEEYFSHKDDDRREKYLKRAKGIKNKQGELKIPNQLIVRAYVYFGEKKLSNQ